MIKTFSKLGLAALVAGAMVGTVNAQDVIFYESMGNSGGTVTLAAHNTANGFDNSGVLTFAQGTTAGVVDVRTSSNSGASYTGSSGASNIWFAAATDRSLAITGIDASNYSDLTISFGVRKESTATNALSPGAQVWYSTNNGASWTSFIDLNAQVSSALGAGWVLLEDLPLPAAADGASQLGIMWTSNDGSAAFRLDDVTLKGTAAAPAGLALDGTINEPEWETIATYGASGRSFGPWGLIALNAFVNSADLYIGVRGTPEANFNSTYIFLGSPSLSNQVAAGTPLAGLSGDFGGLNGTILDFDARYVFRLTTGNTGPEYYLNVRDLNDAGSDHFLGGGNVDTPTTITTFNAGSTGLAGAAAYDNGPGDVNANVNTGLELQLSLASLGLSDSDIFNIFAVYGNGGGDFLSSDSLPEVPGNLGAHLGGDPNFQALPGRQFATFPLPAAEASISGAVSFGAVDADGAPGTAIVTITALEDGVTVDSVLLEGAFTSDFSGPVVLASEDDITTFTVSFDPAANDGSAQTGRLFAFLDAANNPDSLVVNLSGTSPIATTIEGLRAAAYSSPGATVYKATGFVGANNVFTASRNQFSLQSNDDGTTPTFGVLVDDPNPAPGRDGGPLPSVGDQVTVVGTLTLFNNTVQFVPNRAYEVVAGSGSVTPVAISSGAEVTVGAGSATEYVVVQGAPVVIPAPATAAATVETASLGGDTFWVRLQGGTGTAFATAGDYDITGVVGQFNGTPQLMPRSQDDIEDITPTNVSDWMILVN